MTSEDRAAAEADTANDLKKCYPEVGKETAKCQTCKREMTEAEDCEGDCVFCMADAGDTDVALQAYEMMKAQRDAAVAYNRNLQEAIEGYREEAASLTAEVARLMETLTLIAAGSTPAKFLASLAIAKAKP